VAEGDYLLEVNGRPLAPPTNPYSLFEGTAGRQTLIRVNKAPSMEGSRVVTVIPVPSEDGLRTRAWIEDNRRLVDRLSNGKLAYVWLPNTAGPGYTYFTRYFFAQQQKEGAIIDERYNHGGQVADYIVNELDRKVAHQLAIELVHDVVGDLPAVIVSLVDDRGFLLRSAAEGRRDHRRAIQSRRAGRRLHRERARSQADGLLCAAQR